ncbi:amidohydrolase family protein [Winogradskyella sp. A3E31]|uniref:amidohydrolase family protein n=1 Tax=Winogradskyella sp. A3E31 TaxID=3349637 RepID=UPI00398BAF54
MKQLILLLVFVISASCAQNQGDVSASATLISDVNIIDVASGEILRSQNVIIDSGKISQISESIKHAELYTKKIDGKDKFLMPGLAEMHAHIPQPSETNPGIVDETLFLYLSNGITTIRGMLGHPSHLNLREKSKNNEILAPRIYTSSPSLNGNTIKTVAEAKEKVARYENEGYDFLKIHPGIQLEVFDAAINTAKEVGIPFAGHVPVDVGVRHAMESGYASIDHIDGFLEGLVPDSENVNPNDNGFFGYNFTALADKDYMDELVIMSKEHKVWIVSTQSLFERWFAPITAEELLEEPEMKYMAKSTLDNWKSIKARYTENEAFDETQWENFNTIRRALMLKLQKDGHGMLLGSDAPQLFNVPGFSIHHEIEGMRKAGLTPLEIIQSGTLNPAVYFNATDSFGQVKEGLGADLMLLSANPLEDLSALKNLTGVMVKGQWLSKEDIDSRLAEIAEANIGK